MQKRLRILVADDDAGARRATVRALKLFEGTLDIVECGDGVEAARLLRDPFDCVFLDYLMPNKDGMVVLRECREAGIRVPIVLLTGQGDENLAIESIKAGATDYLSKSDMSPEVLCQSLRHAVRLAEAQNAAAMAQARLRDAERQIEQRFAKIFHAAPTGIMVTRMSDGRILDANEAFFAMSGYTRDEVIGKTTVEMGAWADPAERIKAIPHLVGKGWQRLVEGQYRSRSGQMFHVLSSMEQIELQGEQCMVAMFYDISEREAAAEALRRSENKYRGIFENSALGLFQTTPAGQLVSANPAFARMLGFESSEQAMASIQNVRALYVDPEDRAAIIRRLNEGETLVQVEIQFRRTDASILTAKMVIWTVRGQDGRITFLEGFMEDITDRSRAENALRESEDRYRRLVELSPDAIIVHCEGEITFINSGGVRLLRATGPEQIVGRPMIDFLHPDYREVVRKRIAQLWQGISVPAMEEQYIRFDGSTVDIEVLATPFTHGGRPAVQVIARDITERRRMQAALRETNDRLEALVKASPLAICSISLDGKVEVWNPAAERIFGWSEAEVLGQSLPFIPEDRADEYKMLLGRVRRSQGFTGVEVRRQRKDGAMVDVSLSTAPVYDAKGRVIGIIGMIEDITEAKRLKEQLLAAHRMETVGRLAGGIAHDFNNLLAVISGYSEALMRRMNPEDPMASHVSEIEKAAQRGATLTQQLLAFSRRQPLKPQVLDLNQIIASIHQMLRRVISDKIEITLVPSEQPAMVRTDRGQMEQVLVNLAINARDAMPDGGRLTIATTEVSLASAAAAKMNLPAGHYIRLDVQDTGIGMDEQVRSRIFEPFFTTKAGKGTGLGLSIVYGIVQQCGGAISAASQPGKGSTFTLLLPRARRRELTVLHDPAAEAEGR